MTHSYQPSRYSSYIFQFYILVIFYIYQQNIKYLLLVKFKESLKKSVWGLNQSMEWNWKAEAAFEDQNA